MALRFVTGAADEADGVCVADSVLVLSCLAKLVGCISASALVSFVLGVPNDWASAEALAAIFAALRSRRFWAVVFFGGAPESSVFSSAAVGACGGGCKGVLATLHGCCTKLPISLAPFEIDCRSAATCGLTEQHNHKK